MRLIDADALTTSLDNHRMPFGQGTEEDKQFAAGFNAGLNRAQYTAAYAPTITPAPRWIPVEERLPETECNALVAHSDGFVCCCQFWGNGDDYFARAAKITHWMPLPEPPKEATP